MFAQNTVLSMMLTSSIIARKACLRFRQEAQLSLGWPTVLVVNEIQGHPKSLIFM